MRFPFIKQEQDTKSPYREVLEEYLVYIEGFCNYIKIQLDDIRLEQEIFEQKYEDANNLEKKILRKIKRENNNDYIINKHEFDIKNFTFIKENLFKPSVITQDELIFSFFILTLSIYGRINENHGSMVKEIIQKYIQKGKSFAISNSLMDCFDENGKLTKETVFDFLEITKTLYNNIAKNSNIKIESYKEFRQEIVDESVIKMMINDIREQDKRLPASSREIKFESRPMVSKFDEEEEKKKQEQISIETIKLSEYIDLKLNELKNDTIDKISLSDFKKLVNENIVLTKAQSNRYIEKYINQKVRKKINSMIPFLSQTNIVLLNQLLEDNDDTFYQKLKELLLNDNNNIEEVVENVNALIDEYRFLVSTNDSGVPCNLIIFPNDLFLDNELEIIKSTNMDSVDSILKNVMQHFKILISQNIMDIKKNVSGAFHEVKKEFLTPNEKELKTYRFGQKKSKIGIFNISVCAENQKILQELYHCPDNFNVIVVFGLGNINVENERNLYMRMQKNINILYAQYEQIFKIFREPFTPETFEIAIKLIDNSMGQLNLNIEKIESLNSGSGKRQ